MNSNVDTAYISKTIDDIINLVGIKRQFPEGTIFAEFRDSNLKICIEAVANYLGLPIAIDLSYVPSDYHVGESDESFTSQDLVMTNGVQGETEGIMAQVAIPRHLPLYGSAQLKGFPITIKVSNNCTKYPETFIGILAHELSHVVLHSLWHKEKNNEIYTDLTAMTLGFSDIMRKGRKNYQVRKGADFTETSTSTYGYLSDGQFDFAYDKLQKTLAKYIDMEGSLRSGFLRCRTCLEECQRELHRLVDLLQYLDKKQDKRMRHEDTLRIIQMHEPGYIDKIGAITARSAKQLDGLGVTGSNFQHYTSGMVAEITEGTKQVLSVSAELNKTLEQLHSDISVLTRYEGISRKLGNRFRKGN